VGEGVAGNNRHRFGAISSRKEPELPGEVNHKLQTHEERKRNRPSPARVRSEPASFIGEGGVSHKRRGRKAILKKMAGSNSAGNLGKRVTGEGSMVEGGYPTTGL